MKCWRRQVKSTQKFNENISIKFHRISFNIMKFRSSNDVWNEWEQFIGFAHKIESKRFNYNNISFIYAEVYHDIGIYIFGISVILMFLRSTEKWPTFSYAVNSECIRFSLAIATHRINSSENESIVGMMKKFKHEHATKPYNLLVVTTNVTLSHFAFQIQFNIFLLHPYHISIYDPSCLHHIHNKWHVKWYSWLECYAVAVFSWI